MKLRIFLFGYLFFSSSVFAMENERVLLEVNTIPCIKSEYGMSKKFAQEATYFEEYAQPIITDNGSAENNQNGNSMMVPLEVHWNMFVHKYPLLQKAKKFNEVVNPVNIMFLIDAFEKEGKLPLGGMMNFCKMKQAENLHLLVLFIGKLTRQQRYQSALQLVGCGLDYNRPDSPLIKFGNQILEENKPAEHIMPTNDNEQRTKTLTRKTNRHAKIASTQKSWDSESLSSTEKSVESAWVDAGYEPDSISYAITIEPEDAMAIHASLTTYQELAKYGIGIGLGFFIAMLYHQFGC